MQPPVAEIAERAQQTLKVLQALRPEPCSLAAAVAARRPRPAGRSPQAPVTGRPAISPPDRRARNKNAHEPERARSNIATLRGAIASEALHKVTSLCTRADARCKRRRTQSSQVNVGKQRSVSSCCSGKSWQLYIIGCTARVSAWPG